MSLSFIDTINAELKRRHQGLVTTVGWKERSVHSKPPCVRWIADAATYGDAVLRQKGIVDRFLAELEAGEVTPEKVGSAGQDA